MAEAGGIGGLAWLGGHEHLDGLVQLVEAVRRQMLSAQALDWIEGANVRLCGQPRIIAIEAPQVPEDDGEGVLLWSLAPFKDGSGERQEGSAFGSP